MAATAQIALYIRNPVSIPKFSAGIGVVLFAFFGEGRSLGGARERRKGEYPLAFCATIVAKRSPPSLSLSRPQRSPPRQPKFLRL